MHLTRRRFAQALTLPAFLPAVQARSDTYKGVHLGIGTYSFHGQTLDDVIRVVPASGAASVELESAFVEPAVPREQLRQWRLDSGLAAAKTIRKRLDAAGIRVYAYNLSINDAFTDPEIEAALGMTQAFGASILNTSTTLPVAKRVAPLAEKRKLRVGLHPSGNAIGSGASYLEALQISPAIGANPDLYLFRNWGPDPVAFIRQIHDRITTVHFHDRKGTTWVPFGEGDMPTRELLHLAQKEKYRFPFSIERIYTVPNLDPLTELRRSLAYCRGVLDHS